MARNFGIGGLDMANAQQRSRLLGIDLARFTAIVGMMIAHLAVSDNTPLLVKAISSGYPSTLFAVLGGFGTYFASAKYLKNGNRLAAVVALLTRGVVVMVIGALLGFLPDHNIAVVLVYFGAAIAVVSPFVLLPSRALLSIAGLLGLSSPFILFFLQGYPNSLEQNLGVFRSLGSAATWPYAGPYPVVTWTIYLSLGIVFARLILETDSRKQVSVTVKILAGSLGSFATVFMLWLWRLNYVVHQIAAKSGQPENLVREFLTSSGYGAPLKGGWDLMFLATSHSGTLFDVALTSSASLALISALLLLTRGIGTVPWLLAPIAKVGAAPLTSYVAHIAMTAYSYLALEKYWASPLAADYGTPWWSTHMFSIQLLVLFAFGAALAAMKRKGPLETLTSALSRAAASRFIDKSR